jgi:hypothetical protein
VRNSTNGTGHPLPFSTTSMRHGDSAAACAIIKQSRPNAESHLVTRIRRKQPLMRTYSPW